jgi:hypothetical protein
MLWNLKLLAVAATLTVTSLVGTAMYAHNKGSRSGMLQIQTQWDAERAATQAAQAEEAMKARQREQALQALVNKQRRAHDAEVKRVVREYAGLVDGLRDRPEAPGGGAGGVPQDSGAGTESNGWCTGARLYRDHATVLAGQAALAAELQSALRACLADRAEIERAVNFPENSPSE